MNSSSDDPDLSKPLSRWSAPYWAIINGIAAHLEATEWKVLCALYAHLPNVRPGQGRIEALAGVSSASVKRARKRLKEVGLISYPENQTGGDRTMTTDYSLADIRSADIHAAVISKLTGVIENGAHDDRGQDEPRTRVTMNPHGDHDEPPTGVTMNPKVLNSSTQGSSQVKSEALAADAAPPSHPASQQTSKADRTQTSTALKRTKLTDEQKILICSNRDSMLAYYCFGPDAIGKPASMWAAAGKLSPTNWAPTTAAYAEPESGVGLPAVAAWTWLRLCQARRRLGLNVSLPKFEKFLGVVKSVTSRLTHAQFVAIVNTVSDRWPEIQRALGEWGRKLNLDETILNVSQVQAEAERLQQPNQNQTGTSSVVDLSAEPAGSKYAHCFK